MPVILRVDGFKFFFFANEGDEPIHVHVEIGDEAAKFWMNPISLARNYGMKASNLSKVRRILEQHQQLIEEKWDDFNRKKTGI